MTNIVIEAKPRESLLVSLVGVEYQIVPPKAALALKMAVHGKTAGDDPSAMIDTLYEWIDLAFGDQSKKVKARLESPTDDLDIDHISTLMGAVIEAVSGNPTT
jgi:hypothetical protein